MNESKKISLNVDSELWQKFRVKTVQEQTTATKVLEDFIRDYVKKENSKSSNK